MCRNCNVTYYGKAYHHLFTRVVELMGVSNLRMSNHQQFLTTFWNVAVLLILATLTYWLLTPVNLIS